MEVLKTVGYVGLTQGLGFTVYDVESGVYGLVQGLGCMVYVL